MGRYGSKPRISAAAVRLVVAGLLLAASLVYLHSRSAEEYTLQVIPPTCTESGYTLATSTRTGGTDVRDVGPGRYGRRAQMAQPVLHRLWLGRGKADVSGCGTGQTGAER